MTIRAEAGLSPICSEQADKIDQKDGGPLFPLTNRLWFSEDESDLPDALSETFFVTQLLTACKRELDD